MIWRIKNMYGLYEIFRSADFRHGRIRSFVWAISCHLTACAWHRDLEKESKA